MTNESVELEAADVLLHKAWSANNAGRPALALTRYRRLLTRLPERPPPRAHAPLLGHRGAPVPVDGFTAIRVRALLGTALATYELDADLARATATLDEAEAMARAGGMPGLVAAVVGQHGLLSIRSGEYDRAIRILDRAVRIGPRAEPVDLATASAEPGECARLPRRGRSRRRGLPPGIGVGCADRRSPAAVQDRAQPRLLPPPRRRPAGSAPATADRPQTRPRGAASDGPAGGSPGAAGGRSAHRRRRHPDPGRERVRPCGTEARRRRDAAHPGRERAPQRALRAGGPARNRGGSAVRPARRHRLGAAGRHRADAGQGRAPARRARAASGSAGSTPPGSVGGGAGPPEPPR